jgi:transposase
VSHATFLPPDLTTFCRLDELGLEAAGQLLAPGRAVLECRAVDPDDWCRSCGAQGIARGTVTRPTSRARTAGLAADDAAGEGPPLQVHRVRSRVAAGHLQSRATSGKDLPSRTALGAGRWALEGIVPAPHRRPCRGRLERVLAYREQRDP